MTFPIEVEFHHMEEKPEFRKMLIHEARKLERKLDGIKSCHIVMELPYHHRYVGNPYRVTVEVSLPGSEIIVSRYPSADGKFTDGLAMIRDVFNEIARNFAECMCGTRATSAGLPVQNFPRHHRMRSSEEYPEHVHH